MKVITISIVLAAFSSYSFGDADWCSYETENREPNGNEMIFCPVQKTDIDYESSLAELKKTIKSVKNEHPKYANNHQEIETSLLGVIEKHKSYLEAKCDFEGYNYIFEKSPSLRGTDGDKYITVCKEAYKTEAIKKINEIIASCQIIDKEYELPCIY